MDIGGGFLDSYYRFFTHCFIRRKSGKPCVGYLTFFESDRLNVVIMLNGVCGDDDIPNVDLIIQRSRDACIDDLGAVETIDQRMGANARVDLAHAALDDDDVLLSELSLAEIHLSDLGRLCDICGFLQCVDLNVHRADDADYLFFLSRFILRTSAAREHNQQKRQSADHRKYFRFHVKNSLRLKYSSH